MTPNGSVLVFCNMMVLLNALVLFSSLNMVLGGISSVQEMVNGRGCSNGVQKPVEQQSQIISAQPKPVMAKTDIEPALVKENPDSVSSGEAEVHNDAEAKKSTGMFRFLGKRQTIQESAADNPTPDALESDPTQIESADQLMAPASANVAVQDQHPAVEADNN